MAFRRLTAPGTTLETLDQLQEVHERLQAYLRDADAHDAPPHHDIAAAAGVMHELLLPIAPTYTYCAVATGVVSGDTFTADVDLGFRVGCSCSVRIYGVTAPELEKPGGRMAALYLEGLLLDRPLLIRSYNDAMSRVRWPCQVWTNSPGDTPVDVAEAIIASRHGLPAHEGEVLAVRSLVD